MFTIIKSLFLFTTLFSTIALLGLGCSTTPLENTNQTATNEVTTNESKYPVTFSENVQSSLNPTAKLDSYLPVGLKNQYVNKEKRVEIGYYNVFTAREEITENSFRVIFDLIDDAFPEISDRSPISLEIYNIRPYSSIRYWMDEHFKDPETKTVPEFSFEVASYPGRSSDLTVFEDKKSEKRFVPLYNEETGSLILFTVHHQNSRELLALANSMMLQFEMAPELDYGTITDTSDWKTYRNEEYGFEMRYPKNYTVTEGPGELSLYVVSFMDDSFDPNLGGPSIHIKVMDNPDQLSPVDYFNSDGEGNSVETNAMFESFPYLQNAQYYFSENNDGRNILLQKGKFMFHFIIVHAEHQKVITIGNSIVKSFKSF